MFKFLYFITVCLVRCSDVHIHVANLYGNSDQGYYYVNVYLGNNRQKQSLIIDTASSITTLPCIDCKHCGKHIDQYYDYKLSKESQILGCDESVNNKKCPECENKKCSFSIHYAEGSSLKGYYFLDNMIIGDEQGTQYFNDDAIDLEQVQNVIGCTTTETNLFLDQKANGIMGLSPKTSTPYAYSNYIDTFYQSEKFRKIHNFFSLCIGRVDGYMAIGQYDTSKHPQNKSYHRIKYIGAQDFYRIQLKQIKVNDEIVVQSDLTNAGQGTFIDSGATLVHGAPKIVKQLKEKFSCNNELCPEMFNLESLNCYQFILIKHKTLENFATFFPSYFFEFENDFIFEWKPINYLTLALNTTDYYCLPILELPGQSRLILGQVWMRNWDIGFNRSSEEIVFIESQCSNRTHVSDIDGTQIYKRRFKDQNIIEKRNITHFIILSITEIGFIGLIVFIVYKYLERTKKNKNYQKVNEQKDKDTVV